MSKDAEIGPVNFVGLGVMGYPTAGRLANGVLTGSVSGAILVDHTTVSSELALELAVATAGQDCGFLDAPVSGGQASAAQTTG